MEEIILIRGKLVAQGERLPLPGWPSAPEANYAFYDQTTGEVWGQRIILGLVSPWHYLPGESSYPDLLLPYEHSEAFFQTGLLSFFTEYLLTEWEQKHEHTESSSSAAAATRADDYSSPEGPPDGAERDGQDPCDPHAG